MIKIMKSQSGNVALAMLIAVIAVMSGLSISSMSLRDTISAQNDLESIQSLHLLRAEALRGQSYLETAAKTDPSLSGGLRTPLRSVPITGSHFEKTYTMQSQVSRLAYESEGLNVDGQSSSTGQSEAEYKVKSLVESKTGIGQVAYFSSNKSIVRKYSELQVFQDTGPIFMYFTEQEQDPGGEPVRFDGKDYFNGPVHSNSDIWIRQTTGANDGWPLFDALVTTSGVIKVYPDGSHNFPEETVFPAGLIENYQTYEYPSEMTAVRQNGSKVGPPAYSEDHIVLVEARESGYNAWLATIGPSTAKVVGVWPNYPFGYETPQLFNNRVPFRDTTWTPLGGGTSAGRSNFVNSKLWIKGTFQGKQTWGAADSLFLIGDILLHNVTPPASPVSDRSSMVGLISEESIVIKYGYFNPIDTLRHHTNMGADNDFTDPAGGGIWIYAALAALGNGGGNGYEDGVFTFEYQHPHGSIPEQIITLPVIGDTLFTWIDLHRNRWPQTASALWPPMLDFPWYNPLWPEKSPYLMRGTINIWGGVNQKRRGFVRRNYVNDPNNNPQGLWHPPTDLCGGSSAPNPIQIQLYQNPNVFVTLQTRNFPGATSSAQVGYRKNYNYDTRMYKMKPPDWPEFKKQGEKLPMEQGNWLLKKPPRALV